MFVAYDMYIAISSSSYDMYIAISSGSYSIQQPLILWSYWPKVHAPVCFYT